MMGSARISSLLGKITVLVAICFVAVSAQAKYGGGTGEPNYPYLIYTAEQMNAIGADSNDWDKHFKLMADIDLSGYTGTAFNIIGELYYDSGWVENPFTGVFDGNSHTISNFTYNSNDRLFIGLFGYVGGENAIIKDLGLIDPDVDAGTGYPVGSLVGYNLGTITACYVEGGCVSGDSRVGGLVGINHGTITNCSSNSNVSGDERVGGLVGYNSGTISNCYSIGSVSGDERVGGLVGINEGSITDCYSSGSVSGDHRVGGLVGKNYFNGTITNCYSAGSVLGDYYVGGLVGYTGDNNGTITNCYATGSVSGNSGVGGLVGKNELGNELGGVALSFWDIETSGQTTSAGGTGKTTTEMKTASTYLGWNGCGEVIWTIDEGNDYPRLLWEGRPGQPLPQHQLTDFVQGTGTETDPYLISTAEQLNLIGLFTCEWDKHFMLTADVDLINYNGTSYNIIGAFRVGFAGVFDGNDHKITNLSISETYSGYLGLFGLIGKEGKVKNLGLEGGSVSGSSYVGGLVGRNDGSVTNCYSTGSVSGTWSRVGGLVGDNRGRVLNCYSTGDVSGNHDVAGLCGSNWYGTINNCYSTASVSGDEQVGGLVGRNHYGIITNSYSIGSVSGDDNVGGLAGGNYYNGTITNCYSTGSVSGNSSVGGFVGRNGWCLSSGRCYPGKVSYCYSTGSVSGTTNVGGLVGFNQDGTISNSYSEAGVSGDSRVGGLVGYHYRGKVKNCYSAGFVMGSINVGGLVGDNYKGTVSASFWDIETSGQDWSDGGTGLPTAEMQTMNTFIDSGWDFVGETVNGIEDIWFIGQQDYPHLWWEGMQVPMKLTPGTLNCRSKGNWVKAHLTLPQGFTVEDVNPDRPAVLHSFGFESTPPYVFVNEDGLVEIEAAFEREAVCSLAGNWPGELTVAGFLSDGNIFLGTSTVRIIHPGMKVIEELASYWLNADCVHPDFCDEIDMNRDSLVNLLDYALLMNTNVEFVSIEW